MVGEEADRALEDLSRAVVVWIERRNGGLLTRWLRRELDSEGAPVRLTISALQRCLEVLAAVKRQGRAWPEGCDERVEGMLAFVLRFARPDGGPAMCFDGPGRDSALARTAAEWARAQRGTGLARVLRWWFDPNARTKERTPPPLPAWSSANRALAVLRPDWLAAGDFLAIDHRAAQGPCRFELFGTGRSWLGPEWLGPEAGVPSSRPRPRTWITTSAADLAEWSYPAGPTRITRSVLLLRGRHLALLSVLVEGRGPPPNPGWTVRWSLPPAVAAAPLEGCRGWGLTEPGRRGLATVLPIGLPCLPYPTDRGRFQVEDRALALSQAPVGRRCWLTLLVAWGPARHRKAPRWRALTVSERSKAVPADRAFAARVSWGRDESYVIYRSLGPCAARTFLGHQTHARFLIGQFTNDGDVEPILSID